MSEGTLSDPTREEFPYLDLRETLTEERGLRNSRHPYHRTLRNTPYLLGSSLKVIGLVS